MNHPPRVAKLSLLFNPAGLREDLGQLRAEDWITHFNHSYFEGEWTGVALRAADENETSLFCAPTTAKYIDTSVLSRCPHFAALLEDFHCELRSARLLKLNAGSHIREHRDYDLGWEAGEVRLHVPVITNPDVQFFLEDQRVIMNEGECWYLDLSLPHRVQNSGTTERVHLVLDCVLNDWLRAQIAQAPPPPLAMIRESGFEQFRRLVLTDPGLQIQLQKCPDVPSFTTLALRLGRETGCLFTSSDVDAALKMARRNWIERAIS